MTQQQPRTKPSTRFVRHKQEEEHFRDLAACYQNLTDLCELFDRGQHFISSLIAVEIAKLVAKLRDYVKAHPGQRIEQIAKGMGTSTRELNLPAKKLLAQKALKTKGEKRATKYFSK